MTDPAAGPFISVVIPVRNEARHLRRCLDALLSQDYPADSYEILVVDDSSTDDSAAIARRYDRVAVFSSAARGAYPARNLGVNASRGDVVAFTDAHCVADHHWLRAINDALGHADVGLVCGRRLPGRRSLVLDSICDYERTKDSFVLDGDDEELYYGFTSNMAVRRSLLGRFGPFVDVERGADALFVRRVVAKLSCGAVRFAPEMVVTNLQLHGLLAYCSKMFVYGRHRTRNNAVLRSRPLRLAERMAVFRRAAHAGEYSIRRAAVLLTALGVASLFWSAGRIAGRLR